MSVWYAIPSARKHEEAARIILEWRTRGYKIALLRQPQPDENRALEHLCDMYVETDTYFGWPLSVNHLAKSIVATDPKALWVVTGGDDYLPDWRYRADQIGMQCSTYFRNSYILSFTKAFSIAPHPLDAAIYSTWGIMQPTGDRHGAGTKADIETAAASPWMGREWIKRAYKGAGPMWPNYRHFFADTELQHVAQKLGVFWQRPDLTQEHKHWTRQIVPVMPPYMEPLIAGYDVDGGIFEARKLGEFPGHEPL